MSVLVLLPSLMGFGACMFEKKEIYYLIRWWKQQQLNALKEKKNTINLLSHMNTLHNYFGRSLVRKS